MSRSAVGWFVAGVVVTVLIAVVVSQFASSNPDGLEYVADRQGFSDQVEDHDLADAPLAERNALSFVDMEMPTVRQDVTFGPANLGLEGRELDERVAAALASVEVADLGDRPPNHLSFGQKRRVTIAGVMAMEPEILVLDEPTSNLDPASRNDLTMILDGLDVTRLIVTHDLLYALEVCERSLIIDGGKIVADGPTSEVLGDSELLAGHRLALPAGLRIGDFRAR